jgi:integration host factor subunit beta
MIRSELIEQVSAANPSLSPRDVEHIVTTFFDAICDQLGRGGRVELRGFGSFSTRSREARTGRNPRTGSSVDITAKKVPYFKPGKEVRSRLKMD